MAKRVAYQTLRRLAYFEAIARAGSIRGAARRLGLSVPVLSSSLSDLEEELGVTLATRSTRRLDLTSAGQEVYSKASTIIEAAQDVLALSQADRSLTGKVGVTLAVELALYWLPRRISRFRDLHPAVALNVDVNDRVVDLASRPIDIAIRTRYRPRWSSEFADRRVYSGWLDLVVVGREQPEVKTHQTSTLMVDAPFIVAPGGTERVQGYRVTTKAPVELVPSGVITVASREAAITFAREGLGCALVTELAVADDIASGRLVSVLPDLAFGGITLQILMRDKLPSAEARAFSQILSDSDELESGGG